MAKKEKTFEELTTNWQRVLDSAITKSKVSDSPQTNYEHQQALFWGDIPGMTEKEKQAIAWAHFNYQVENGGISQYLTCNNFGDELPFVLDVLYNICETDQQPLVVIMSYNIQQMAKLGFCPSYVPNDNDCKKEFRNYNYDKAVAENWESPYDEDDDEYYDDFYNPDFTLGNGQEFDDYYYANQLTLAKILDKYFAQK